MKHSGSCSSPAPIAPGGLRLVNDRRPGLARRLVRGERRFIDHKGRAVRDEATIERIQKLAIPPAWSEVWICPLPQGHIQATGRDVRRRKQYRYHAERLAKIVRRLRDLPGQELFQYLDTNGAVVNVGSADINAYLRETAGEEFSAKDFRTWAVAARLGNTVAVCARATSIRRSSEPIWTERSCRCPNTSSPK